MFSKNMLMSPASLLGAFEPERAAYSNVVYMMSFYHSVNGKLISFVMLIYIPVPFLKVLVS